MAKSPAPVNSEEARELFVYITNNSTLYCANTTPVIANLKKRHKAGDYNKEKAITLWAHVAAYGAKAYRKEYAPNMVDGFSVATRKLCGEMLENYYFENVSE